MRNVRSQTLVLVLLLGGVTARAESPAPGKTEKKSDLPKALPRLGDQPVKPSDLPPYLGMFGSEDLIAKVGFRGGVGSYIEYRLDPKKPEADKNHGLRMAQVAPEMPGARWIEMTSKGPSVDGTGIRLLTRGNGKGNVERLIIQSMQAPPMEMPLSAMIGSTPLNPGAAGESVTSDAKHVGHEKVEVPLGKFETEHWIIAEKPRLEIWTTRDERVPFIGAVKMLTEEGYALAAKVGTDATAMISAPAANE